MSQVNESGSKQSELSLEGAYEALRGESDQLEEQELIHINLDVLSIVTTALGVLPKVVALREQLREELPKFDLKYLDQLETYAMALYETHADYLSSTRPVETLPQLIEEATNVRDTLYADAQAFVQRKLLDAHELREVKTSIGHKQLAMDLEVLAGALHRKWELIQGKTAITMPELLNAGQLARRILRAVGEREQAPAVAAEVASQRARAYTLFLRAYDNLRRAVTYLRWHEGDADRIAPSLYAGRGVPKRKSDGEVEGGASPAEPSKPQNGSAPGTAVPVPSTPSSALPAGLPGSDPFVRA